ncbi:hypothetical protein BN136_461 [Cronobacter universalis NCTC 9529]|nr:hypothetical protein BN136_461 [Cronobacter universalis NCTC 9529]
MSLCQTLTRRRYLASDAHDGAPGDKRAQRRGNEIGKKPQVVVIFLISAAV